jgi:hypothetical protein
MTQTDDTKANIEWSEHFQGNYRLMTEAEKAEARTVSKSATPRNTTSPLP